MLVNKPSLRHAAGRPARQQRGVVLLVALIVLVAMTLAGVALIRSVDTANVIAGNLAFRQSATSAGERSTEIALVGFLGPAALDVVNNPLWVDQKTTQGYVAQRADPLPGQSWEQFWNTIPANEKRLAAPSGATCPSSAAADLACNRVEYVIHRLCDGPGKPNTAVSCTQPPPSASGGSSAVAGGIGPPQAKQVYYRITTRVQGPRNTVSYVQTIVAL